MSKTLSKQAQEAYIKRTLTKALAEAKEAERTGTPLQSIENFLAELEM